MLSVRLFFFFLRDCQPQETAHGKNTIRYISIYPDNFNKMQHSPNKVNNNCEREREREQLWGIRHLFSIFTLLSKSAIETVIETITFNRN